MLPRMASSMKAILATMNGLYEDLNKKQATFMASDTSKTVLQCSLIWDYIVACVSPLM